jgi:hypothetical protein
MACVTIDAVLGKSVANTNHRSKNLTQNPHFSSRSSLIAASIAFALESPACVSPMN